MEETKKIILKTLDLSNFREVSVSVTLHEEQTEISGRNRTGKSSLQQAWNWLLTGYTDPVNPKNHELFDSTKELNENTPMTRVKATIFIDGKKHELEKTAEAKFVRKRGETSYEKAASDSYVYYIDERKVSVAEFNSWLEGNICPIEMLPYCLDGAFFANLAADDTKKGRKVLEDIVGEVKDDELSGEYAEIIEIMNEKGYSIEQVKEQYKNKLSSLKDDESRLRSEIEVKEKTLQELQSMDFDAMEQKIKETKQQIEEIDNTILGKAEAIKPILGQRDAIFEIIDSKAQKLSECRNTYTNNFYSLKNDINAKIRAIKKDNELIKERNDKALALCENNKARIETQKTLLKRLNEDRDRLIKERDSVKEMVFTDDKCSFCGQQLPADMLEEKQKEFNNKKTQMLESIVAKGKNIKTQIEQCSSLIEILEQSVDNKPTLEEPKSVEDLEKQLQQLERDYITYENTDEYKRLFNEIEDLKKTLPEIPQSDNEALTNVKKSLINDLEIQNRMYGKKQDIIDLLAKIEEQQKNLRTICNEEARHEGILAKVAEYIEEKANIVSRKVNDKLSISKIQMYRTQKDGSMAPDCRVYSKEGVPFSTINMSYGLLVRIDLQRFFCKHFGIQMPIFVDEYKSFDDYTAPKSKGEQMIMLYPSNSPILEVK